MASPQLSTSSPATRTDSQKIPQPRWRLPILGDLLSIDVAKPVQREMRMAQELGGIFERKIFRHRLIVVSGADLVREVNDEEKWAKFLGKPLRKLRVIAGDGLFTAFNSEPNWRKAHNILGPGFSQAAMRGYHDSMLAVIDRLLHSWDVAADGGEYIDVPQSMTSLTFDVIGRCGLSYDFDSFGRAEPDPFIEAMSRALEYINRSSNDIPILRAVFGRAAREQHTRDIALMQDTVDRIVDERMRSEDTQADLLELMMRTADPDTGEQLGRESIRNQVLTFLVAGNETTAATLGFAVHFLSRHPEVVAKARAEIAEVVGADGQIGYEQVAKLRYVRRIVDETLRLWPAAPGYFRKVRGETTLGGRTLPPGSWVFVLLPQLHRDPLWGDDPERFDPDRFAPDAVRRRPAHIFKPWGTGIRACIGRQFALHEAVLTLASLIRRYDFAPEPGYELDVHEAITLEPRGLKVKLSQP
ncbi:cytochrome P450 [Rhodococcus sp. NPDC058639]|uniref:cytochrome P450 n=1 Tax=Rhodococcus sp. NPDC058639 TaxID=3346570 RepID=UPI003667EE30